MHRFVLRPAMQVALLLLLALAFAPVADALPGARRAPIAKTTTPGQRVTPQARANAAANSHRKPVVKDKSRVGLRAVWRTAKENFQIYRGDKMERWANRIKVGRSDFKKQHSVKQNLADLVKSKGMEHYYAQVEGRDVLHIVVDLGKGAATKDSVRSILRRVGNETVELNYKAATEKNVYGHVAVRVGNGALYDLTGTQGVANLPKFMERTLHFIRGTTNLTFARKRNMRRFMETRSDSADASAGVYYGMLFAASPKEVAQTQALYNQRIKQATNFNVNGGDGAKGEFSCAQFLTENVPFFNDRGVGANIGAKSTTSAAQKSLQLEAVVVYKAASVASAEVKQFP